MGRPSPAQKKVKRAKQKARRKIFAERSSQLQHAEDTSTTTTTSANTIGDVDMDNEEMKVYDFYREEDGQKHSREYLLKCRSKLMDKVELYKHELSKSEEEKVSMSLAHKKELEKVRQFYQSIAFGLTHGGRMVRAAMGTTQTAQKIRKEMAALFSTENDHNFA